MIVCDDGLLRDSEGYIAVALSDRYGQIGSKFKVTLSTGIEIKLVKVDVKQTKHLTNACYDSAGAVIEFVVCTELLPSEVTTTGSVGAMFGGTIERIQIKND